MVIPCSGIGKIFGTVGRQAMYEVVEKLRPGVTDTVCLSLLVLGDEEARQLIKKYPAVTIDGCPIGCARKNVEASEGKVGSFLRAIDIFREHKDLKPLSVIDLGEKGRKLASLLAQKIAEEVDRLLKEDGQGG